MTHQPSLTAASFWQICSRGETVFNPSLPATFSTCFPPFMIPDMYLRLRSLGSTVLLYNMGCQPMRYLPGFECTSILTVINTLSLESCATGSIKPHTHTYTKYSVSQHDTPHIILGKGGREFGIPWLETSECHPPTGWGRIKLYHVILEGMLWYCSGRTY